MKWILVAGALCLSAHHDICIKQGIHPDMPFTLYTPHQTPLPYWTLDSAKRDGERRAMELEEFEK